jgi:hypothetical protein
LSKATEVLCGGHGISPNALRDSVLQDPKSSSQTNTNTSLRHRPAVLVPAGTCFCDSGETLIKFAVCTSIDNSKRVWTSTLRRPAGGKSSRIIRRSLERPQSQGCGCDSPGRNVLEQLGSAWIRFKGLGTPSDVVVRHPGSPGEKFSEFRQEGASSRFLKRSPARRQLAEI